MSVSLAVSGIQAALRAAQTGLDIYAQANVDKTIYLSNIRMSKENMSATLSRFIDENRYLVEKEPFVRGWNTHRGMWRPIDEDNLRSCIAAYTLIKQSGNEQLAPGQSEALAGGQLIAQWREGNEPPSALARATLAITDIALSFVAQNPTIMGQNSKGEALVLAFAASLSDIVPDDVDDFGKGHDFHNRLLGTFLKAGLRILIEDQNAIIKNESVRVLLNGIVKPINEALPTSFNEQFEYRELIETIIGPSTANALAIIAATPQAYLGNKFESENALKAVTQAVLHATSSASAVSIQQVFTKEGLTTLIDAALNVAIEQPALFLNTNNEVHMEALSDLFVNTAILVKSLNQEHDVSADFASELSAIVIKTISKHASVLMKVDKNKPWESLAFSLTQSLLTSISANIHDNKRFALFSAVQRMEYARLILVQLSHTPQMLAKHDKAIQNLIAGLAGVIAQDENLLLSNDDWLDIISTAATLAGMNPQLLFSFKLGQAVDELDTSPAIIISCITTVLEVINQFSKFEAQARGVADKAKLHALDVMQGVTLNHVMQSVLEALANDITGLKEHPDILVRYFSTLLQQIIEKPEKWGSGNITYFIESTIESVFMTGDLPAILIALEQRN